MGKIRILPENIANKIAAGEVVERPASVVKELTENSIDAGARHIRISCESGGKKTIVVTDDGEGMDKDDVLLAFERHATSKLGSETDFLAIATMGFRGEALPSIAAVSRLRIVTGDGCSPGTDVLTEGGVLKKVAEASFARGTRVEVSDLFFNLPARKKFLRTVGTELGRIVELTTRFALAFPAIDFELRHGDRELLRVLPAAGFSERVSQVFGAEVAESLLPVEARADTIEIRGFISKPGRAPAGRNQQYISVNNRPVNDRLLLHAVREGIEPYYRKENPALLILFLTDDPAWVDVNVHPTKSEVRFKDTNRVHSAVRDAFRRALEREIGVPELHPFPHSGGLPAYPKAETTERVDRAADPLLPLEGAGRQSAVETAGGTAPYVAADVSPARLTGGRILGQYRLSYILLETAEGLVVIDQHVAHERILYEKVLRAYRIGSEPRQALLSPKIVKLPAHECPPIAEQKDLLVSIGIEIEDFGSDSFLVRALPSMIEAEEVEEVLRNIAQELDAADKGRPGGDRLREGVAKAVACASAVKANTPLTREKMEYLVEALLETEEPYLCPHGRPVLLKFSHDMIERKFGR
jgi:DNA mismatch repair protein MutL